MQITPIQSGNRKGYKASYNHKGVQIVEFAPTRIEAIGAVWSFMDKFIPKPCGHIECIFDICGNDIPF